MKIQVFAMLKDYFEREFEVKDCVPDIQTLKERLISQSPAAAGILTICRFAVGDEFIDEKYQLKENDTICIIPPGSGG